MTRNTNSAHSSLARRSSTRNTMTGIVGGVAVLATLSLTRLDTTGSDVTSRAATANHSAAADGGYGCLRETGGGDGQCAIAEGGVVPLDFSRWTVAADGGYGCLRDTGGGDGQCAIAEGDVRPDPVG